MQLDVLGAIETYPQARVTLMDEKTLTNSVERRNSRVEFLVCFLVIFCEKDSSRMPLYGLFYSMKNYIFITLCSFFYYLSLVNLFSNVIFFKWKDKKTKK